MSCVSGGGDGEVGLGCLSANGDTCPLPDARSGQVRLWQVHRFRVVMCLLTSIKNKYQE